MGWEVEVVARHRLPAWVGRRRRHRLEALPAALEIRTRPLLLLSQSTFIIEVIRDLSYALYGSPQSDLRPPI